VFGRSAQESGQKRNGGIVRRRKKTGPVIIGLAGGTGSGKTTIARFIARRFPRRALMLISHDCYYHDHSHLSTDERAGINYDHPRAFDTELLVAHLNELMAGRPVAIPEYDYTTHSRLPQGTRTSPADILLVEGILVLDDERLRNLMDIKLFVDTDSDERFIRRLRRDIEERGRTLSSVIEQYQSTVKPMHLEFVEPSKRYADVIIPEGVHNRVAMDLVISRIRTLLQEMADQRGLAAVPSPS